ncbi:hypothetical protein QYE76_065723 [Lolium multiflorum]|uniref:Retrotransposon gag domain-containing protein n=1 Tax=Lolium multiflorum TaxID=4521 RepID=A0AAD8SA73_LOLMU|nr:hypothetical protein QYE76_065723 [Lolium multiflorum]
MGKPRDTKIAILPSTTRKGTTLSTSAALDSPSVIDKLVSPPHASRAGTSAESENSHNIDNVSAVLDDSGSLGSFLDATIAKSRQIENTETPNATTPVKSPELDYSSDDLDEDYVELDDDFIEKCNATTDARKIKKLLAEHAVRYKPSPDPKFATSPINIRDKDYDFSLDLSHIAIVEKTPFCGTEKESAVEHLTELSTLSGVFSDDVKMRTYFVAKIFPFSLKDDAKTWYNNLPPGSIKSPTDLRDVFFRKYFPASAQHAALQRIYNFDQEDGEKLPEAWARFCSLIRAQPDHDLEKHDLLDIFYSGLTIESRAYLDSCAGCVFRKRTPDAEELLAKIGRNHDDWSTPEPTPTPIVKKRGMIKLNDEDMREAKKSLKEKGIKPEDVKNLPPIEDICETIPPSSMIEYMKDIVTNKRKVPNEEISTMLANYSFNGKIPKKLGDPVTQHCLILTDFVVLEMPEDDNMSIILGRPFLNTAGAVIDCNKGMVTFNVDDKEHTVYFPKRIDKDFEFHRSRTDPMVRYKIYNKTIDLPFSDFCTAIRVPQWGSCEKIRGTPRELSDLYTRICNGRSFSNDGGAADDGHNLDVYCPRCTCMNGEADLAHTMDGREGEKKRLLQETGFSSGTCAVPDEKKHRVEEVSQFDGRFEDESQFDAPVDGTDDEPFIDEGPAPEIIQPTEGGRGPSTQLCVEVDARPEIITGVRVVSRPPSPDAPVDGTDDEPLIDEGPAPEIIQPTEGGRGPSTQLCVEEDAHPEIIRGVPVVSGPPSPDAKC